MITIEDKIQDLLEEGGVSFKKNSLSFIMTCPRCNKKDKLYIRRSDGRFVCWFCKEVDGYQGKPEYALADLLGLSVGELQQKLHGSVSPDTLFFDPKIFDFRNEEDNDIIELPEAFQLEEVFWPYEFFPIEDEASLRGRAYLEGRGIPLDVAMKYGIRYCPPKRRVVFPVMVEGKLVGWQERLIVPHRNFNVDLAAWMEAPKALTSKGMKRDAVLMFGDLMKGCDHVILCEGPVDAIKADRCGGNVATLGKAVTAKQIELLKCGGVRKVYLGLDRDAARETQRLVDEFNGCGIECYDMTPPREFHDLGEMSFDQVYDLFLHAERVQPGHLFVYIRH
jgi:hypothetical protein